METNPGSIVLLIEIFLIYGPKASEGGLSSLAMIVFMQNLILLVE